MLFSGVGSRSLLSAAMRSVDGTVTFGGRRFYQDIGSLRTLQRKTSALGESSVMLHVHTTFDGLKKTPQLPINSAQLSFCTIIDESPGESSPESSKYPHRSITFDVCPFLQMKMHSGCICSIYAKPRHAYSLPSGLQGSHYAF
jgi:hypothetical protein